MRNYPVLLDIHTHCISSGHGSRDTVTDMAREAAGRGLKILGISDHGPKTPGAGSSSYFRNLRLAQRSRFGVSLLYGAELNILNEKGDVDLEDSIIASLDYAFISLHHPVFQGGDASCFNSHGGTGVSSSRLGRESFRDICTNAYINAMKHPGVRFIGHPDDGRFPADYERL
ncbi:MAG: PHP domain-containing protein, partial [Lachnospiraceae bacterium]|nr:PHP domain-containing protein [Lachnospiraceae bacterium]